MEEILHHLGCKKNLMNNGTGRDCQPQPPDFFQQQHVFGFMDLAQKFACNSYGWVVEVLVVEPAVGRSLPTSQS